MLTLLDSSEFVSAALHHLPQDQDENGQLEFELSNWNAYEMLQIVPKPGVQVEQREKPECVELQRYKSTSKQVKTE